MQDKKPAGRKVNRIDDAKLARVVGGKGISSLGTTGGARTSAPTRTVSRLAGASKPSTSSKSSNAKR